MGANLSKVLVVDIEATCWETGEEQGDQPNEIIEIGICELSFRGGVISNKRGYVIKPRFTKVSPFCTKLTGWTQEDVDGGMDIRQALLRIAIDYGITKNHVWFSCGEYDRIKLGSEGHASLGGLYGIPKDANPFATMRAHMNIKMLFAFKHKLKREISMAKMISMAGETIEGRHHNGADDAYNIAKIVRHVML